MKDWEWPERGASGETGTILKAEKPVCKLRHGSGEK